MGLDNRRAEVMARVGDLVRDQFSGDYRRAFTYYATRGADGTLYLNADAVEKVLTHAGVGNRFTRGLYVMGVIAALDRNGDDLITLDEFLFALNQPVG